LHQLNRYLEKLATIKK